MIHGESEVIPGDASPLGTALGSLRKRSRQTGSAHDFEILSKSALDKRTALIGHEGFGGQTPPLDELTWTSRPGRFLKCLETNNKQF